MTEYKRLFCNECRRWVTAKRGYDYSCPSGHVILCDECGAEYTDNHKCASSGGDPRNDPRNTPFDHGNIFVVATRGPSTDRLRRCPVCVYRMWTAGWGPYVMEVTDDFPT